MRTADWITGALMAFLVGCGGAVADVIDAGNVDAGGTTSPVDAATTMPVDASVPDVPPTVPPDAGPPPPSQLSACDMKCVSLTQGNCPTLLLYECLTPCGPDTSSSICAAANGSPPPATDVACARKALLACPNACQNDRTCKQFVQCIESCL